MKFSMPLHVVTASLLILSTVVRAETISLPLTDDAWINGNNAGANFGTVEDIFVHSYGPKRGLVRFDAAAISGFTVNSATLELYLSAIRENGTIGIHAIISSWNEGAVTWSNQPPTEVAPTAIENLTTADAGSTVAIDVTGAVQRWAAGTLVDAGFLIATNDGIKSFFDAKEMAGGVPARLVVDYSVDPLPPSPGVGTAAIILDLSNPPVVIDEPGYYMLDRNWKIRLPEVTPAIDMQALATIDLNGFEIWDETVGGSVIMIGDNGGNVTNGRVIGDNEARAAVRSTGLVVIENMTIRGGHDTAAAYISGAHSLVLHSIIIADGGISLTGDKSVLKSSFVSGGYSSVYAGANNLEITGNTIRADDENPGFLVRGDNNIIAQNIVTKWTDFTALEIIGNGNLVRGNTINGAHDTGIHIDGTRNVIKDNIVLPSTDVGIPTVAGISFGQDGNYYGNNSVSALTPYALGSTTQVDLGGNTSF